MLKKLICLLAGLAILIPGLALAGQPSDSLPDPPGFHPGRSPDTLSEEVLSHIPEGIYRTGTPDFDTAREFHISQSGDESLFQNYPIIARGYGVDGYYLVMLDQERWDGDWEIVDELVRELQELGGEDLAFRISVGTIKLLGSKVVEAEGIDIANTEATAETVPTSWIQILGLHGAIHSASWRRSGVGLTGGDSLEPGTSLMVQCHTVPRSMMRIGNT